MNYGLGERHGVGVSSAHTVIDEKTVEVVLDGVRDARVQVLVRRLSGRVGWHLHHTTHST